jgi:transcriptional regulator with XRE-family HTH domain
MDTRGDRIRAARIRRGLSQLDLARILGVTKATISKWELGGAISMDPEHFYLLCRTLYVAPERLLWGDAMEPPSTPRRPAAPPIRPHKKPGA